MYIPRFLVYISPHSAGIDTAVPGVPGTEVAPRASDPAYNYPM